MRSQSTEAALSFNNTVAWNRLRHLGLASKDFGGISTIAYDDAPLVYNILLLQVSPGGVFNGTALPTATWRPPWPRDRAGDGR